MIQENLPSLVPFAGVTVKINYANVTDYPGLAAIMANATTTLRDPVSGRPIVDGDLVYNWFTTYGLGHITNFINVTRTASTIDVPAFLFAFKGNHTFAVPLKEDIGSPNIYGTFGGEALGDMVMIGLSQQADFTIGNNSTYSQPGKGVGFTHDAIHELGHMMGLNHPFIYDLTEDFTNTVMGYYAYSLNYSQFDRDSILRGVNDELLSFALQALSTTQNTILNSGDISMANQNIAQAENLYNTMDYAGAVHYSLAAAEDASAAQQLANSAISPALVFSLSGVAIGVAIGILLGYLIFRRRKSAGVQYNRCPTCQQLLRWDPAQMRWYCDTCQKLFFFSSRRRHTRSDRDWSSDVCSFDLRLIEHDPHVARDAIAHPQVGEKIGTWLAAPDEDCAAAQQRANETANRNGSDEASHRQIGRASCRERV